MRVNTTSRLSLLVAAAATVTVLYASAAEACSCKPPRPPAEELAEADAVFEGYVLRIRGAADALVRQVDFQVLRAWKGTQADVVLTVETSSGSDCGVNVSTGTTWMVYAFTFESDLTMGGCSRSAPSSGAQEDFAALGPATDDGTLAPGAATGPSDVDSGSCAVGGADAAGAAGAVVLFLTLVAPLAVRRPSRRAPSARK